MDYRELFKKYLNFVSLDDDILPSDYEEAELQKEFTDTELAVLRIIEEELDK